MKKRRSKLAGHPILNILPDIDNLEPRKKKTYMKFIKKIDPDNEFDDTKIVVETCADNLNNIFESFEDFCQACGFVIDMNQEVGLLNGDTIDTVIKTATKMAERGKSFLPIYLKSENRIEKELAGVFMTFLKNCEKK